MNPQLPPKLEEIVTRLLDKDREGRYQSAALLEEDLRQLRHGSDSRRLAAAIAFPVEPPSKRRRLSSAVPVFAAAAIAVVAGVYFFSYRAPALTERDVTLLADFVNTTGDSEFDVVLKQALAAQLQQSPFLNIFRDDRVREVLRDMGRPANERVTDSVAREICQRGGINALLSGSIGALGRHYVIALDAVNCETGESLAREQREAAAKENVLTELGRAATSMRAKLGESLASIQKSDVPIGRVTTSSLDAYRAFAEARRQQFEGKFREAVPFAQRAVDLDPDFALAYSLLSLLYRALAEPDTARQYATKAFELRERVGEREKLSISAVYYSHAIADRDKTIETFQLWKRLYPGEVVPRNDLGENYITAGRYEDALQELQEAVRLAPKMSPVIHENLAAAYVGLNRFDEAKNVIRNAIAQKLDMFEMHSGLYLIAFMQGDAQAMQRELEWAKGNPREYLMLANQAKAAAFSGKMREARLFFKQSIVNARNANQNETAAGYAAIQAQIEGFLGNKRQARAGADEAQRLARSSETLGIAAVALAFADEARGVKTLTDGMKRAFPQDTFVNIVWVPAAAATVETRAGNGDRALQVLEPAMRYEPGAATLTAIYTRGLAYLQTRSGRDAAAEFQKILDHRGVAGLSVLYPLSHLGLGRAYALAGDNIKARKSYQDFLAMWKDADPDVPILIQAKQEYEKLQ